MKVWRIPPEQLEKWLEWLEQQKKWSHGFDVIERLTGIRPVYLSEAGDFSFVPPPGAEIPSWFSKPDAKGRIRPRRNFLMGRRLLNDWEREDIPAIHVFYFWDHMGLKPEVGVSGVYRADTILGQLCLVEARGWNPEAYGYEPLEV